MPVSVTDDLLCIYNRKKTACKTQVKQFKYESLNFYTLFLSKVRSFSYIRQLRVLVSVLPTCTYKQTSNNGQVICLSNIVNL